jgi:hypothetical protein
LTNPAFQRTSKRRRGYPSETHVKRGVRIVHGDKEFLEKLGRNDPCPCGSGKCFQKVLHAIGPPLTVRTVSTTPGDQALAAEMRLALFAVRLKGVVRI